MGLHKVVLGGWVGVSSHQWQILRKSYFGFLWIAERPRAKHRFAFPFFKCERGWESLLRVLEKYGDFSDHARVESTRAYEPVFP